MKYQAVFMPYTRMRKRLDAVMAGESDPFPGTSGSEYVEKMMHALSNGLPNPYGEFRLERKVRARKVKEYPLVQRVAAAFIEAFETPRASVENLKER